LTGNRAGRDELEHPGVNCRIILKRIFRNRTGRGMYSFFLGYEQTAGYCENSNEPSVSIKCGEFRD
jgi:hypothetical protein